MSDFKQPLLNEIKEIFFDTIRSPVETLRQFFAVTQEMRAKNYVTTGRIAYLYDLTVEFVSHPMTQVCVFAIGTEFMSPLSTQPLVNFGLRLVQFMVLRNLAKISALLTRFLSRDFYRTCRREVIRACIIAALMVVVPAAIRKLYGVFAFDEELKFRSGPVENCSDLAFSILTSALGLKCLGKSFSSVISVLTVLNKKNAAEALANAFLSFWYLIVEYACSLAPQFEFVKRIQNEAHEARKKFKQYSDEEFRKLTKDADELLHTRTPRFGMLGTEELKKACQITLQGLDQCAKVRCSEKQLGTLDMLFRGVHNLKLENDWRLDYGENRIQPVSCCMIGAPGVGKTYASHQLMKAFYELIRDKLVEYGLPSRSALRGVFYTRNFQSEFMEGYNSQPLLFYNDSFRFGVSKQAGDVQLTAKEVGELQSVIDSAPFYPNFAQLSDGRSPGKGVACAPVGVFLTTNYFAITNSADPNVIGRRIHYPLLVVLVDEGKRDFANLRFFRKRSQMFRNVPGESGVSGWTGEYSPTNQCPKTLEQFERWPWRKDWQSVAVSDIAQELVRLWTQEAERFCSVKRGTNPFLTRPKDTEVELEAPFRMAPEDFLRQYDGTRCFVNGSMFECIGNGRVAVTKGNDKAIYLVEDGKFKLVKSGTNEYELVTTSGRGNNCLFEAIRMGTRSSEDSQTMRVKYALSSGHHEILDGRMIDSNLWDEVSRFFKVNLVVHLDSSDGDMLVSYGSEKDMIVHALLRHEHFTLLLPRHGYSYKFVEWMGPPIYMTVRHYPTILYEFMSPDGYYTEDAYIVVDNRDRVRGLWLKEKPLGTVKLYRRPKEIVIGGIDETLARFFRSYQVGLDALNWAEMPRLGDAGYLIPYSGHNYDDQIASLEESEVPSWFEGFSDHVRKNLSQYTIGAMVLALVSIFASWFFSSYSSESRRRKSSKHSEVEYCFFSETSTMTGSMLRAWNRLMRGFFQKNFSAGQDGSYVKVTLDETDVPAIQDKVASIKVKMVPAKEFRRPNIPLELPKSIRRSDFPRVIVRGDNFSQRVSGLRLKGNIVVFPCHVLDGPVDFIEIGDQVFKVSEAVRHPLDASHDLAVLSSKRFVHEGIGPKEFCQSTEFVERCPHEGVPAIACITSGEVVKTQSCVIESLKESQFRPTQFGKSKEIVGFVTRGASVTSGDCGSVLLYKGHIAGFLSASSSEFEVWTRLTKQDVDSLVRKFGLKDEPISVVDNREIGDLTFSSSFGLAGPKISSFSGFKQSPPNVEPNVLERTEVVEMLCPGEFLPSDCSPVALKKALSNFKHKAQADLPQEVYEVAEDLAGKMRDWECDVLPSMKVAANGCCDSKMQCPIIKRTQLDTSPGKPFTEPPSNCPWLSEELFGSSKEQLFGRDSEGRLEPKPELVKMAQEVFQSWKCGLVPRVPFTVSLKREIRPKQKVVNHDTRLFSAPPAHYNLALRYLFGNWLSKFKSKGIDLEHALGSNMNDSIQVGNLVKYVTNNSKNLVACPDFSKYDTRHSIAMNRLCAEIICSCYPQELHKAIKSAILGLSRFEFYGPEGPEHVLGGLASGSQLTTQLNCMFTWLVYRGACRRIFGEENEKRGVRLITYGDDCLLGVDQRLLNSYGKKRVVDEIIDFARECGYEIKSCFERGDLDFLPITKGMFLRRTFEFREGQWFAPIDISRLFKCCSFYSDTDESKVVKRLGIARWLMLEFTAYDGPTSRSLFKKFKDACCGTVWEHIFFDLDCEKLLCEFREVRLGLRSVESIFDESARELGMGATTFAPCAWVRSL
nr:MAG: RNA-dependent RNA polymerase [Wufeng rodent picorna-like virus 2]